MIKIKDCFEYSEEELLVIIDFINAILSNAEMISNDEYVIGYDDMSSLNESILKLRRCVNERKNATSKRSV